MRSSKSAASLPAALVIIGLLLAGCGSRQEPAGPAAARTTGTPAAQAPVAAAPPAAEAITKAAVTPEVESVTNDTFSISPIARAVAAATPDPTPKIPSRWVEGTNYELIVPAQPVNTGPDKVEVTEVFWYGCPHCYHLEPALESWRKSGRPAFVEFSRMPVVWSGDEIKRAHARLFFVMQALGKLSLHDEVFKEIHVNGNPLVGPYEGKTEELQKAFLLAHGVTAADFDRTYRSPSVELNLQRAEQYTQRYRVISVPRIIVAGKYAADLGTASAGQPKPDDALLFTLVNDLSTAEHRR